MVPYQRVYVEIVCCIEVVQSKGVPYQGMGSISAGGTPIV